MNERSQAYEQTKLLLQSKLNLQTSQVASQPLGNQCKLRLATHALSSAELGTLSLLPCHISHHGQCKLLIVKHFITSMLGQSMDLSEIVVGINLRVSYNKFAHLKLHTKLCTDLYKSPHLLIDGNSYFQMLQQHSSFFCNS